MATRPIRPKTVFCHLGALTTGSKNAAGAISALESAGDLEGHQAWRFLELLLGDHDVDVLELSGAPEVRHEVRHGRGGEGRPGDLEGAILVLESRDPHIAGNHVREGIEEEDGP